MKRRAVHFAAAPLSLAVALGAVVAGPSAHGAHGARVAERDRIGTSLRGRVLEAVNVGARSRPTRVLVVGCIHGNECAGKAILGALHRRRSPRRMELWLIWSLNPDGARAGTRQNARGVDLNRNFGAGWRPIGDPWDTYHSGPRPWSEPETRAARRFVRERRPDITIWYHQSMRLVTKRRRHRRYARRYAQLVGLPYVRLPPIPGTAPRWQDKRFPGHSAFVVELPAGRLGRRAARRHARAVVRVGRMWRRRHARRKPGVAGRGYGSERSLPAYAAGSMPWR